MAKESSYQRLKRQLKEKDEQILGLLQDINVLIGGPAKHFSQYIKVSMCHKHRIDTENIIWHGEHPKQL